MLNALRLARAGFVLARAGLFSFMAEEDLPPPAVRGVRLARLLERRGLDDAARGRQLSEALNRLGPSYVKLGQFLATRPDIVGAELADTLSGLKDEMPPFPTAQARAIVAANLGRPVDAVFLSFSEPVAAASIAQVHKAVVVRPEGEETVAVKVLRPDVRGRFARDLSAFYSAARAIERHAPETRRLKPLAVVETLHRSVVLEMDLRLEAAAISEMAENVREETDFRLPALAWDLTGRDVLVTEWIDGIKLRDVARIEAAGHDRRRLAVTVIQSFLRHALRDGFFHADMHEGNLFVDPDGRIVAVDLGIMGRIGYKERKFLAEILYGFIRRDYLRIAEVHFEAGYVPAIHSVEDFAQALRAIGEPIHGHRASDISMAKLLTLLFEITEIFDMQTRPELILLQKTMVVVEGVARRLDPEFDMWSAAEPVVSEWVQRFVGPHGVVTEFADGLSAVGRIARQMPALARRFDRISENLEASTGNGLKLDDETIRGIGKEVARNTRWNRMALWLIAVIALVASLSALIRG
ncbi:2-polyprenylphenol 6-hydroxylase [Faunimonas sp. B44]|uniref:2-polyprenylphenol 6-hydroxylase n=1 Tax=Faunimonas sp. B44 TaxID=3461493 RepID=UPI0040442B7C